MYPDLELVAPLGSNEFFRIDRCRCVGNGARVLVKSPLHGGATAELAALQRELALVSALTALGNLQPQWIERAAGPALVMDDPGGELLSAMKAHVELPLILAIAKHIASMLSELHRGGRVHNGIRPDTILCDSAASRAWLIDFSGVAGDATRPAGFVVGGMAASRLVYASPEQTGRTERAPDHRSDFYALGVVLYELLTGTPPFRSDDALELIHGHIARAPVAPIDMSADIPVPVSDIVLKLLAKTPEARYQSAAGLIDDLNTCTREWSAHRRIAAFPLGRRDIGERLSLLPRLYGRAREAGLLQTAFEGVRGRHDGRPLMLLVAGYPGIGKTALIREVVKPVVRPRGRFNGYFVSGKCDQIVRSIPFGALIQAFRDLVQQQLTESETRLEAWRNTLTQALGANGGVLAEVIPEIEFIIGKQEPPVRLEPTESMNRFRRVLQNFIGAVGQPANPLVIFLDDLQWADEGTLSLLEPLLTSPDIHNMLLIGAYRDTELDSAHRLTHTLAGLEAAGVDLQRIVLGPLRLADLSELIRDMLGGSLAEASPFAQLVLEKTGGNPFFVIHFLKTLERDGHFRFDSASARWMYSIDAIARAPLADDVVDLMTHHIQRLSAKSQYALTLAACIGNRFDRRTLATISEQSQESIADDLDQAAAEGLILPVRRRHVGAPAADDGTAPDRRQAYIFLHDRVQQAAYALIPESRRPMLHLKIGRLLHAGATSKHTARLFDIVYHMNLGRSLIATASERLDLARLNLEAGRTAKSSTAHDAARDYFHAGLGLLNETHWQSDYELCSALHLEAAESEYLCGDFDAAQAQFERLLQHAETDIDRARVYRLRSVQYENMARYADALAIARTGLALFDVSFPEPAADKAAALDQEIARIGSLLGERPVASLIDLPVMTDPKILIVMNILTDIWALTFILGDPILARLISATMVRLSLLHGNVGESAFGYVTHAITVGPHRGDYPLAYEFGALALAVNQRFADTQRRAKIYQQFHAHVNFWRQPMASCIPYAREAYRSGIESGDFLYAAYGAATETWPAILATQDLAQFVRDYEPSVARVERLKNQAFADSLKIILNWARALQGQTEGLLSLSDGSIDEHAYLHTYRDNPFFTTFHAVTKLQVCCLLGTPAEALQAARVAGATAHHVPGTVWPILYEFWSGLALAANHDAAAENERAAAMSQIVNARDWFDELAKNCPENFLCPALLLAAEVERIDGRTRAAIDRYERTIEYAAQHELIQYRALANELCGRCRLERGEARIAALFIAEARSCYAVWGAAAKVDQLERAHPEIMRTEAMLPHVLPTAVQTAPAQDGYDAGELDLLSVMKAAQAIGGETELDRLLARLMQIAIENAGAERAGLVLDENGGSVVYTTDARQAAAQTIPRGTPLADSRTLPTSLVNYVRRTSESVVLSDAAADDRYGSDSYIAAHKPRSVMCLAVQKQGRLVGVLYLENSALAGVFTAERIRIVQLLATEAAIALENACLIDSLKRQIREREDAQQALRNALGQVERLKEDLEAENVYLRGDLIANVSHDLRTPMVSMRGYLELLCAKDEELPADTRRSYLEIALRQSEYLATLIDELFELAKLEFKGLQLDREPFQFAELAVDVLKKFQLAADAKQVTLRVEMPNALPQVYADLALIERVLDNLIGNALQHTPNGGLIRVSIEVADASVIARVSDTGRGIAADELPFIFDRFYRVEKSRNRASGGAGLGLAIAKRIVELHDSEIIVDSKPNEGSCFSFSLPVHGAA